MRIILHCDLDAFYASVEQLDHPEWRGKPVIVGGRPDDRGVVSAASYEARAFGVHSAMPLRIAARLCPHAIFTPGDHARYADLSDRVMALFAEYTPLVEPISLDEAFLDVTASAHLFGGGEAVGRALKQRVHGDLGLVLSVGMATNKLCAKIASELGKPNGFVAVPPGGEAAFLAPLPLRRLWGVGERTYELLAGWGLRTIGELAEVDRQGLDTRLGLFGAALWERAHGLDDDPVFSEAPAKSVGAEHTFDRDETELARVQATLVRLTERVGARLREAGLRGRCITLKLRLAPFDTRTRRRTVAEATDDDGRIYTAARELLQAERAADERPVRLIGVTVSDLEDAGVGRQLALFGDERAERLNQAIDALRTRHGAEVIERAAAREADARRRFSDRRRS